MISNSKILTVSYGTFSCTLEGFDDSFGTMKAIAEYFRDLAADDRYFGAEPPTPDAEMLARIAEREIARRVEAHEDGGKIVLRAEDAAAPLLAEAPVAEPRDEAANTSEAPKKDDAPAAQPEIAEEPVDEPEVDQQAAADEVEEPAEPEVTEAEVAEAQIAEEDEDVAESAEDAVVMPSEEEAAAFFEAADEPEADTPVEPAAELVEDDEIVNPDPDSVAAKLSRIRSVVTQSGADYGLAEAEDDQAQDFLESTAADLDAVLAEDDANEPLLEEDDAPVEAEAEFADDVEPVEVKDENDDISFILNSVKADEEAEVEAEIDHEEPVALTETEEMVEVAEEIVEAAEIEDAEAQVEAPETSEIEDTLAQLMADAMPADDADEIEDEPEAISDRSIDMDEADFEDALTSGQLEEASSDNLFSEDDETAEDDEGYDSSLSPEDEAELQRELAEVEAEFTSFEDAVAANEASSEAFAAKAEAAQAEAEQVEAEADEIEVDEIEAELDAALNADEDDEDEELRDYVAQSDDVLPDPEEASERGVDRLQRVEEDNDVSRIFDEADSQLDEPDSSKRRNAIQHLRAAVAATRAEKKAGKEMSADVDDTPYRTDLADVVRPRRPRPAGETRSQRPGTERPAPLKLVAEQRIDTAREPIRPRRVRTHDVEKEQSPMADGNSFAEFAEEVGAGSLPELLEAAAAYMADIEGRPQFSRPMLMGKLKEVEGDSFSREDGLRSFGQLLRQGKLQKLNGGRFAVTDDTEFRAPKRNVG